MIKYVVGGPGVTDYTDDDLAELATFTQTNNIWRFVVDHGQRGQLNPSALVAIAAPDGQVAVWQRDRMQLGVTGESTSSLVTRLTDNRVFSLYWASADGRKTVRPFAEAAARLLHANAFEYPSAPRDEYLAEWANVRNGLRPDTEQLLSAKMDALAAASALLVVGDHVGAADLIRMARGLVPRVKSPRKKRTQISGSMYAVLLAGKAES